MPCRCHKVTRGFNGPFLSIRSPKSVNLSPYLFIEVTNPSTSLVRLTVPPPKSSSINSIRLPWSLPLSVTKVSTIVGAQGRTNPGRGSGLPVQLFYFILLIIFYIFVFGPPFQNLKPLSSLISQLSPTNNYST